MDMMKKIVCFNEFWTIISNAVRDIGNNYKNVEFRSFVYVPQVPIITYINYYNIKLDRDKDEYIYRLIKHNNDHVLMCGNSMDLHIPICTDTDGIDEKTILDRITAEIKNNQRIKELYSLEQRKKLMFLSSIHIHILVFHKAVYTFSSSSLLLSKYCMKFLSLLFLHKVIVYFS